MWWIQYSTCCDQVELYNGLNSNAIQFKLSFDSFVIKVCNCNGVFVLVLLIRLILSMRARYFFNSVFISFDFDFIVQCLQRGIVNILHLNQIKVNHDCLDVDMTMIIPTTALIRTAMLISKPFVMTWLNIRVLLFRSSIFFIVRDYGSRRWNYYRNNILRRTKTKSEKKTQQQPRKSNRTHFLYSGTLHKSEWLSRNIWPYW